ncbi:MAG TPA: hypothetical protein VMG38_24160 [Trebonia sp.]|nr:hypothetical protein [Trebonia sp.]
MQRSRSLPGATIAGFLAAFGQTRQTPFLLVHTGGTRLTRDLSPRSR